MARCDVLADLGGGRYRIFLHYDTGLRDEELSRLDDEFNQNLITKYATVDSLDALIAEAAEYEDAYFSAVNHLYTVAAQKGFDSAEVATAMKIVNDAAKALYEKNMAVGGARQTIATLDARRLEIVYDRSKWANLVKDGRVLEVWSPDLVDHADHAMETDAGTMEVVGVVSFDGVLLPKPWIMLRPMFPGYSPKYACGRDHKIKALYANGTYGAINNICEVPLASGWNPRYALATLIDLNNGVGTVKMDWWTPSTSDPIPGNFGNLGFYDVPFNYMDCGAAPFRVGDHVVVEFGGRNMASPRIIGFRDNPRPCPEGFLYFPIYQVDEAGTPYTIPWPNCVHGGMTVAGKRIDTRKYVIRRHDYEHDHEFLFDVEMDDELVISEQTIEYFNGKQENGFGLGVPSSGLLIGQCIKAVMTTISVPDSEIGSIDDPYWIDCLAPGMFYVGLLNIEASTNAVGGMDGVLTDLHPPRLLSVTNKSTGVKYTLTFNGYGYRGVPGVSEDDVRFQVRYAMHPQD